MYDFITITLMFFLAVCVYILFDGAIVNKKKQIVGSSIGVVIIVTISIIGFYIDSNSSYQELLRKVEQMYRNHERSYLSIPRKIDKVRMLNGWIIDYLAIEYLEKAIENQPDCSEAKIKLCEILLFERKYNDVIKHASTIYFKDKENTRLLELEAVAYYKAGYKNIAYEKYNYLSKQNAVSRDLYLLFKVNADTSFEVSK